MHPPEGPAADDAAVPPQMLLALRTPPFEPVVVETPDLLRVEMDTQYRVRSVSLISSGDATEEVVHQWEVGLVDALNEAVRRITERNTEWMATVLRGS